jgi:hypothetical protein
MHVILDSSGNDGRAIKFVKNPANVSVHFITNDTVAEKRAAIFGGEHHMEENFREGLWHRATVAEHET